MSSTRLQPNKILAGVGGLALLTIFAFAAFHEALPFILAGGIALICGLYLFKYYQHAIIVFIVLFYSNAAVIAYQFHGVPQVVAAAVPLLLGLPLAHTVFVRREGLIFDRMLLLMLVFLGALILSTLGARDIFIGLNEVANYVLEGIVLYFLVLNVIRTRATLQRVIWTLLCVCSFLGVLSVVQELTNTYEYSYGGFAQRKKSIDFEELDYDEYSGAKRAEGPVGEQNRYAQMMVVIAPFALYLMMTEVTRKRKLWALAVGCLTMCGVLLTFSRGTFLAMGLAFLLAVAWGYVRPRHALLGGLLAVLTVAVALPDYLNRITGLVELSKLQSVDSGTRSIDGSLRGRFAQNLAALHVFMDHPVFGVGPAHFSKFYVLRYGNEIGTKRLRGERRAHNMYLETAANMGLFGLVAFLAIVSYALIKLWQARQRFLNRRADLAALATTLILSIVLYLVTAVFLHLSYQRYYWFLLALVGSALQVLARENVPAANTAVERVTSELPRS